MVGRQYTASIEFPTIVTNAADAIDMFDKAGKQYPFPGREVAIEDILEVIDFLGQRRPQRLLGWCGLHADLLLRVDSVSLREKTMTVVDLGETTFSGVFTIAHEPHPKAAEIHGDLVYELRSISR